MSWYSVTLELPTGESGPISTASGSASADLAVPDLPGATFNIFAAVAGGYSQVELHGISAGATDADLGYTSVDDYAAGRPEERRAPRFRSFAKRRLRPSRTDDGFEIRRIIGYRNSFRPRIRGSFEPMPNGVCVRGTMSLDALAQVFMVGWLSLSGVACIACLAALRTSLFEPRSLSPLGMVIFGTALMTGGFLFEARQSLKQLNRSFDATSSELTVAR